MSIEFSEYLRQRATEESLTLSDRQVRCMEAFFEYLQERNKELNLTALTGVEETVEKHILDALAITHLLGQTYSGKMIDVGSGAGFPGIPLAVFYPAAQLTLLDATKKRCAFLEAATQEIGLTNTNVVCGRAEEIARASEHREQYDLATARAVARLATLSELCLPFVKVGGAFCAYKGDKAKEEMREAAQAVKTLGASCEDTLTYESFGAKRSLLFFRKTEAIDEKYPRRNGIPGKRPL